MPGTDKHHHKNNWAPTHWGLGEIDGLLVPPMGGGLGEIEAQAAHLFLLGPNGRGPSCFMQAKLLTTERPSDYWLTTHG